MQYVSLAWPAQAFIYGCLVITSCTNKVVSWSRYTSKRYVDNETVPLQERFYNRSTCHSYLPNFYHPKSLEK